MTEKGNEQSKWAGWARTDGPSAWKMNRFQRRGGPIKPAKTQASVSIDSQQPPWSDVTHIVRENIETLQNGESLEPTNGMHQKIWGGRTNREGMAKQPPVFQTPIKPGEATVFQQTNYEILSGIQTDAQGEIIVREDR